MLATSASDCLERRNGHPESGCMFGVSSASFPFKYSVLSLYESRQNYRFHKDCFMYPKFRASQHPIVQPTTFPSSTRLNTMVQSPGGVASRPRGFSSAQTFYPICRMSHTGPCPKKPSKDPYSVPYSPVQ